MTKLVRVTENIYKKLHAFAGRIQAREKRPISLSEAIEALFQKGKKPPKVHTGKNQQKTAEMPQEPGKAAEKSANMRREIF